MKTRSITLCCTCTNGTREKTKIHWIAFIAAALLSTTDSQAGVTTLLSHRYSDVQTMKILVDYDGPDFGGGRKEGGWGLTNIAVHTVGAPVWDCIYRMADGGSYTNYSSNKDSVGDFYWVINLMGQPKEIECQAYAGKYTYGGGPHSVYLKGSFSAPPGFENNVRVTVHQSGKPVKTLPRIQFTTPPLVVPPKGGKVETKVELNYADQIALRKGETRKLFHMSGTGLTRTVVRCNGDACAQLELIHGGPTHSLTHGKTIDLYGALQASIRATAGAPGEARGEIVIEAELK